MTFEEFILQKFYWSNHGHLRHQFSTKRWDCRLRTEEWKSEWSYDFLILIRSVMKQTNIYHTYKLGQAKYVCHLKTVLRVALFTGSASNFTPCSVVSTTGYVVVTYVLLCCYVKYVSKVLFHLSSCRCTLDSVSNIKHFVPFFDCKIFVYNATILKILIFFTIS